MIGISNPDFYIRLNSAVKQDMTMWLRFLVDFNGKAYFPQREWTSSRVLQLFTDSAGSAGLGCGCYFGGRWIYYQWPCCWNNQAIMRDITFLELVPIVLSVMVWGEALSGKKVQFHTDNMALVAILNSQSSKSPRIMCLLRQLVLFVMKYNITFKAKHIAGLDNSIADAISRKQWRRFRNLALVARKDPDPIPARFHSLILEVRPLDC